MKRKYKYMSLTTNDIINFNRIKHILAGEKKKKEVLLKYLYLGLDDALKMPIKKKNDTKHICSIPLRFDHPEEGRLIEIKKKLGHKSSEIFINAILLGFGKQSPLNQENKPKE